ncbi:porin family protein [Burkholderiaceae bacterium DAT-1]|nr:porin family protein [Burkholderiaceae bacterium DAT-1]
MKKLLCIASLLTACALPAMADNLYVTGDFGQTKTSISNEDGKLLDGKTSTAWSLGAGYRFDQNVAFELGYRDWGKQSLDVSAMGESAHVEDKAHALVGSVVGTLPLTDVFSLQGRLGYANIKAKLSANNSRGQSMSFEETYNKVLWGVGARYAVSKDVGIRAEYSRTGKFDDTTLSAFTVGVDYSF